MGHTTERKNNLSKNKWLFLPYCKSRVNVVAIVRSSRNRITTARRKIRGNSVPPDPIQKEGSWVFMKDTNSTMFSHLKNLLQSSPWASSSMGNAPSQQLLGDLIAQCWWWRFINRHI